MAPLTRKRRLELEEEELKNALVFHFYSYLPWELKRMIIKKMDGGTKLALMLCSDFCAVDMPKNFIRSIKICNPCMLKVKTNYEVTNVSYSLYHRGAVYEVFKVDNFGLHMEHLIWKALMRKESLTNAELFLKIIKNYPNLECLHIQITKKLMSTISNIRYLKNLKSLKIENRTNVDLFESGFIDFEQLSEISNSVELINFTFPLDQLIQLTAKIICISRTKISSEYVRNLITRFLNGEIPESVQRIYLDTEDGYSFDNGDVFNRRPGSCPEYIRTHLACVVNSVRIAEIASFKYEFYMYFYSKKDFYEKYPIDTPVQFLRND